MNIIKNQDRILEAIDQLRRRKARPDAERICNFVLRRFSVNTQDTKADLKRLVDADIVVKVEYKGNTSYRNAAKWSRFAVYNKNKEETLGINQGLASLSSGIAELIIQEPDYLDFGVPVIELKKFMQQKDKPLFTEQNFELILEHEVIAGNLVKLENGNYSLADHPVPSSSRVNNSIDNDVKMLKIDSSSSSNQHSEDDNDTSLSQANNKVKNSFSKTNYNSNKNIPDAAVNLSLSSDRPMETSVMPVGGYRVGGRRKRAKKVFDPSDNNLPTRKRGRPFGSLNKCKDPNFSSQNKVVESAVGVCYICHQRSNRRGNYEKLISCRDCTHRAHRSCAVFTNDSTHLSQWQCLSCKTCSVCFDTSESNHPEAQGTIAMRGTHSRRLSKMRTAHARRDSLVWSKRERGCWLARRAARQQRWLSSMVSGLESVSWELESRRITSTRAGFGIVNQENASSVLGIVNQQNASSFCVRHSQPGESLFCVRHKVNQKNASSVPGIRSTWLMPLISVSGIVNQENASSIFCLRHKVNQENASSVSGIKSTRRMPLLSQA
uniref:Zinc finger PHD-type domain-containing protein n=1 Tax=Timema tahoe TaxID=61484 RepID=A0A7R9IRI0_9NEOP|nr:unnamed protein product [Timema tahoe]